MRKNTKFLALVLAASMIVSLTACTKKIDNRDVTPRNTPSTDGSVKPVEDDNAGKDVKKKVMAQISTPDETHKTSENLAYHAKVTANENETDYFSAECAVDGIVNRSFPNAEQSRWSTNRGSNVKILTLDLGEEKTFNKFVIEWERENILHYSIRTSDDGKTYTSVIDKEDRNPVSLLTVDYLETPVTSRYVQLYVDRYNGGTIGWNAVSVYEFAIYSVPESEAGAAP